MALYQSAVNCDESARFNPSTPYYVNDISTEREEDREAIAKLTITTYTGDRVSLLPVCKCEKTKGFFSTKIFCHLCNTEVKNDLSSEIEHVLWFRKPKGINKIVNPHYWIALKKRLDTRGFSIVSYFADASYKCKIKTPVVLGAFIKEGITQRGFNYFVDNMLHILRVASKLPHYKTKSKSIIQLIDDIERHPQEVFCDQIPLPNKSLLLIEYNNLGIFIDDSIRKIKNVLPLMIGIDVMPFIKNLQNRTAKCLDGLIDFYEEYFDKNLKPKEGFVRKHLGGSRSNYAWRCVLGGITKPANYDEIHVPWCMSLVVFKEHILNRLLRYGYDLNSAVGLIHTHHQVYHPLIASILDGFIEETNNELYCVIHRSPSLMSGSSQLVRITSFKKDPLDRSMNQSVFGCANMNSDTNSAKGFIPFMMLIK